MNKKLYENPNVIIIVLNDDDIISTSGTFGNARPGQMQDLDGDGVFDY